MPGAAAETLAVVLLIVALALAIVRPRGISEAAVAVPAAAVLVVTGVVPWDLAWDRIARIGPTVGFLAAILAFGRLCADAAVFDYLGALAARGASGRPRRLLAMVVGLAACVTVVLTLDATVVLLTPVVLATAARCGLRPRPYAFGCVRLANSASLLLPVSNLTNLLAFSASGVSFGRFVALMAAPWVLVCLAEWLNLHLTFRRDLTGAVAAPQARDEVGVPHYALAVLAITVAGIVVTASCHLTPAWAALGGCLLLFPARGRTALVHTAGRAAVRLVRAASPGFCVFVLALAVLVDGVTRHGLGEILRHVVPSGTSFVQLLALALAAAALANLVNNLPATLALVPLVAGNPAAVLAMLVGVNIGPNATYVGSLATLLWRRLVPSRQRPGARQFHLIGLVSTPPLLVLATAALWVGLQVSS